jgi:hypothetical protein
MDDTKGFYSMHLRFLRAFLILVVMPAGMGESLHALNLFDSHHTQSCEIVSQHFDSPDQIADNDCPFCHIGSINWLILVVGHHQFRLFDDSSIQALNNFLYFSEESASYLLRGPPVSLIS